MRKKSKPVETSMEKYDRLWRLWNEARRKADRLKLEWQDAADQVRRENARRDKQESTIEGKP